MKDQMKDRKEPLKEKYLTLEMRKKELRGQIRQINGRDELPQWKFGRRKAQAKMAVDIGNMKYNL